MLVIQCHMFKVTIGPFIWKSVYQLVHLVEIIVLLMNKYAKPVPNLQISLINKQFKSEYCQLYSWC